MGYYELIYTMADGSTRMLPFDYEADAEAYGEVLFESEEDTPKDNRTIVKIEVFPFYVPEQTPEHASLTMYPRIRR